MNVIDRELHVLPETIHLVGIGGIGLSAIARVLAAWGHKVQGSDMRETDITRGLEQLGITVFVGQRAEQVAGADLVVMSSAVPLENAELVAARELGIPIVKRHWLLGEMLKGRISIAVAGTHGKTTTSAMFASVLRGMGQSPTFIVGGVLNELGTNAASGSAPYFVVEADEYDRTFHGLHPTVAVVTNIEMDHPDCYDDLAAMQEAYRVFLQNKQPGGTIVACVDNPSVLDVLSCVTVDSDLRTYGHSECANYRLDRCEGHCRVLHEGRVWAEFELATPGEHNALNATSVLVALDSLGFAPEAVAQQLCVFGGVHRRLEKKGRAAGVVVYDDYAHHPTEIRASLAALREFHPEKRVVAVFQPHTYSRTETLWQEFCSCFDQADVVIVLPVFAARSKEHQTVTADALANSIRHPDVRFARDSVVALDCLLSVIQRGDLVVTLGAGDGYLIGESLLEALDEAGR